jgi:hypothetical protein
MEPGELQTYSPYVELLHLHTVCIRADTYTAGYKDGRKDGWIDGWMDGWMDFAIHIFQISASIAG